MNFATILVKKWTEKTPPKKILVIRLQAFGDVIISLPYVQSLRNQFPGDVQFDFLTREEVANIPQKLSIFNNVFVLKGKRNVKKQLLWYFTFLPKLFFTRYDVLVDLQNNKLSQIVRKSLQPIAWCEFDKESKIYAGERNKRSIDALGLGEVKYDFPLQIKKSELSDLSKFNLPRNADFIIINPAGFFETRNWNIENYFLFCELWMKQERRTTYFIVLGDTRVEKKANYLQEKLQVRFLNFVNKTSAIEALQILQISKLVVSEDSGLFHMACTTGVPLLGIYGSTRNDWTNPMLPHTFCFNSSDMPCGDCMLEKCLFDEIKCLTRITPQQVLEKALELIEKTKN